MEGGRDGEDQTFTFRPAINFAQQPPVFLTSKDVRLHEDFQHPVVSVAGWSSAPIPDPVPWQCFLLTRAFLQTKLSSFDGHVSDSRRTAPRA